MPAHPIYVPRTNYKGSNAAKRSKIDARNALAARLEAYINERAAADPGPHLMLSYGQIASAMNLTFEQVRDILFSVDAGSGGITIFKA